MAYRSGTSFKLGYRSVGESSFDGLFTSPGGKHIPVISSSIAIQEAFGR